MRAHTLEFQSSYTIDRCCLVKYFYNLLSKWIINRIIRALGIRSHIEPVRSFVHWTTDENEVLKTGVCVCVLSLSMAFIVHPC